MPQATAPLARFVEASGQLRAAWYDAKAYFSDNLSEAAVGADLLHKLESAEELVDEAMSNAESTLKACAKLCQATKNVPQPPPFRSSAAPIVTPNDDMREKKDRPWAAASHQSRQSKYTDSPQPPPKTGKRNYEDVGSDWSSCKRAEVVSRPKWPKRRATGWAASKREHNNTQGNRGNISDPELHDKILPERLPALPQDRLRDLLQDSIEKWLKKRNNAVKEDIMTLPLDDVWGSLKFKIVFPLIDPPINSLADWVSENMDDTTIGEDQNGNTTISRRRVDENDKEEQEWYQEVLAEFIESLPEDSLTDEEDDLRIALLSYLEEWDRDFPPRIADAFRADTERSLEVYLCMWAFLPRRIKLRDWIYNRIGEEVEVLENEGGSFVLQLPSKKSGRV